MKNTNSTRQIALDISQMHQKFGVHEAVNKMDKETLAKMLEFRAACIREELDELDEAIKEGNAEETVDALIDIIVFAVGTLDLYDINFDKAWQAVHIANMNKNVGIKKGRPNPLGLPDLLKPEGWVGPSHEGNHGKFTELTK